jgi:hypothetical protein
VAEQEKLTFAQLALMMRSKNEDPEDVWMAAMDVHDTAVVGIPGPAVRKMRAELLKGCTTLWFPFSRCPLWILCNLTTQDYERCRSGSGSRGTCGFVEHPMLNLPIDSALLLRIFWTRRLAL